MNRDEATEIILSTYFQSKTRKLNPDEIKEIQAIQREFGDRFVQQLYIKAAKKNHEI